MNSKYYMVVDMKYIFYFLLVTSPVASGYRKCCPIQEILDVLNWMDRNYINFKGDAIWASCKKDPVVL